MKGYYKDPEITNQALENDWLRTGDIGYKDGNGYLYVLSRADDMIIKGGMNIYPQEIEGALQNLTEIKECIAYGIGCGCGQTIAVDLVPSDPAKELGTKDFMKLFQKVLPAFQLPTQVNIVDTLERNASGKLIRKRLK